MHPEALEVSDSPAQKWGRGAGLLVGQGFHVSNPGVVIDGHMEVLEAEALARAKSGVDYAIAEMGTVVINPRQGVSRLVSLTPPLHIAVLEAGQVLPSLDELFLLAHDDFQTSAHRGMINLITGPSRTADIEANLVIGVHGPVEVHLVIVG